MSGTNAAQLYFDAPEAGLRITNVLSYDENDELVLTFSFTGGVPGFIKSEPSAQELNRAVGAGVNATIKKIRELADEGALDL